MGAQKQPPMVTLTLPCVELKRLEINLINLSRYAVELTPDIDFVENNALTHCLDEVISFIETLRRQTIVVNDLPYNVTQLNN